MESQKQKILESACEMFFQCGTRSVSMDDISKKLAISKKTLYQYYANKQDLISQVLNWELAHPKFSFESPKFEGLNAIERYWKFYQFVSEMIKKPYHSLEFDLKKYHPELWNKFKSGKMKLFGEELKLNIKQGINEGLYRQELNIDIITNLLVRFYLNMWNEEYDVFSEEELMSEELNRELTVYHLHGICSIKGIECLRKISEK
ncbi:TetR/AcrR family transcriptional regulator [Ancylomarina sp. DW003]|nr:TetR/AcrR family transcriptional regulator [Ancylomarina sp. DW003]MDE5423228.1 TetR/AcrR family transcriptional regulator [Ancylomarina sp. DW003]